MTKKGQRDEKDSVKMYAEEELFFSLSVGYFCSSRLTALTRWPFQGQTEFTLYPACWLPPHPALCLCLFTRQPWKKKNMDLYTPRTPLTFCVFFNLCVSLLLPVIALDLVLCQCVRLPCNLPCTSVVCR